MAFRDSFEEPVGGGGGGTGVSDHGELQGLADDDHLQYAPAEGPGRTITDARIGNRTVDQALASPANTGPITSLLSWITGSIKGITGELDWKNVPATTLKTLKSRADAHEGSRAGHPLATATLDGMMAGADKAKLDGLSATAWTSIPDASILNGFAVYSEATRPRLSAQGELVFMEGVLKRSTAPAAYTAMFTIAPEFRPGQLVAQSTNASRAFGLFDVMDTGSVRYVSGDPVTVFYISAVWRRA